MQADRKSQYQIPRDYFYYSDVKIPVAMAVSD